MSKKPRKKYRPKYTLEQMRAASQDALFSRSTEEVRPEAARDVFAALALSLASMKAGRATATDFNALTTAANIGTVLCEHGVGREYLAACKASAMALLQVRERFYRLGRFVPTGEECRLIAEMLEVREAQLLAEGYTAALDYQAAKIVHDRLKRGVVLMAEPALAETAKTD